VVSGTRCAVSSQVVCRLCGGPSTAAFVVGDRNRGLGRDRFEYRRCDACGVIAIAEIPGDLGRYYAADGYGSAAEQLSRELWGREEAKLALVRELVQAGHMVEIGPGPGLFTRVAQASGFEVTALEMDGRYCRELAEKLGVRAICTDRPEDVLATLRVSSAVVMWHAIEHVARPWELLRRSVENLAPGGVVALSTPNPDSLQFWLLGRYWTHVDAPRHLQLIPLAALRRKLAELGMRLVHVTTSDPVGRVLNRSGWEAALRRHPARRSTTMNTLHAARALTCALMPIETRGLRGAAYTAVFARVGDGD
jgi:2-polyprenyl-3-methyl-5-hydroxy-6-metoxy-1,4-benzoquinol methylase